MTARLSPGADKGRLRAGAAFLAAACLLACQSYEPSPLDLAAHREAWHQRTLEDGSLARFLERLEGEDAGAPEVDLDDGLSLAEGRLVALCFNPALRLARLRAGRAAASAEYAGLWEDPSLSLDVLRITESVPDRWVVTPGLGFTIPLSGRLEAERDLADATLRTARQRALEAEWSVWLEVQEAWVEWSAGRMRVDETERLVEGLESLVQATARLAEAGELARTEAVLFAVEQAQRRNQGRMLAGDTVAAEQRLRALLGLSPEAPVTFVPTLFLAQDAAGAGTTAEIAERNPGLASLREEYQVAEESLRREVKKQIPDLTLGPLFESDAGQSRIGFFGGIPLPVFNANRQAIAEARVEREIARAAFESEYEILVGRWAVATARVEALVQQRADIEQVLVPLLESQLEDALHLMELGEGGTLVLLESLTRAHQTKLDLIESRAAEASMRALLEHLIGPPTAERSTDPTEETP